jgi:hypothetical protein
MPIPTVRFSRWAAWSEREALPNLERPGVYAICVTKSRLASTPFKWLPDICYFGMTNSKGGLRSRLRQFDRTLRVAIAHGGADRFRFKHEDYAKVLPRLYVAVISVEASVDDPKPHDLRAMGGVAYLEYECLARYHAKFGCLPAFNQRSAEKYSRTERSRQPAV